MKTTARYLWYDLKKNIWRTVIFMAIAVLMCLITVPNSLRIEGDQWKRTDIAFLATVLGILCTVIPVLELSEFKNRRNLDTLFFFPIERKKMALVHFLSGFAQIVAIYTVTFIAHYVCLVTTADCFLLEYMPLYYLLSLVVGFAMYSFFCFFFHQGNTVVDGIIICALWSGVVYVTMWVFAECCRMILWDPDTLNHYSRDVYYGIMDHAEWSVVYMPISRLTEIFRELIEVNRHRIPYIFETTNAYEYLNLWYMFVVWTVVGIGAAIGFIFSFERKGAHLAGEPSSSWLGYKTLIPTYGYSLIFMFALNASFDTLLVMVYIMMLVGYIIYRRSFKIKKSDIIVMGCSIVPIIVGITINGLSQL